MDVIVTHTNADFDAAASLVAAGRLYPGAVMVFPGSPEKAVRDFLKEHGRAWTFARERSITPEAVDRLVMVDVSMPERIGKLSRVLDRSVPVHVYDHHPQSRLSFSPEVCVNEDSGSTISILLRIMRGRGMSVTPEEATLFALGIHQDTGGLTFPTTREGDREAYEFLREAGADLDLVREYVSRQLGARQLEVLGQLLHSMETYHFGPVRVMVGTALVGEYVPDVAVLAHKLRDLRQHDAVFILVQMGNRIQMVARSRTEDVDVGEVARRLGGGGHTTAASSHTAGVGLLEAHDALIEAIRAALADKAAETRPPGVDEMTSENLSALMEETLPQDVLRLLRQIGEAASSIGDEAFAVGGFVRDLLLGRPNLDLDVVCLRSGARLGRLIADRLGGRVRVHKRFQTASVYLPGGMQVDFATARREYYEHPGALPEVAVGGIRSDLGRRDFTINAMAVCITPEHFGALIDIHGGRRDLARRRIRVLHDLSFVEDPVRILRAVRFEVRLGFRCDRRTEDLIRGACGMDMFGQVPPARLWEEIRLLLDAERAASAIRRMAELGELRLLSEAMRLDEAADGLLSSVEKTLGWWEGFAPPVRRWLVFLAALTHGLSEDQIKELAGRFPLSHEVRTLLLRCKALPGGLGEVLTAEKSPRPSELYLALRGMSLEELAFLVALVPGRRAKRRVRRFVADLREAKPLIRGEDLLEMGLRKGRRIGEILGQVLLLQLDGRLTTRDAQLDWALDRVRSGE